MEGQDEGAKMEVDEDNNEKKESPTPKAGAEDAAEAKSGKCHLLRLAEHRHHP